jgi:hypothetical protein
MAGVELGGTAGGRDEDENGVDAGFLLGSKYGLRSESF